MEPESRAINYRELPLEVQVNLYDSYLSAFLLPTFLSQLKAVLMLAVPMCGVAFSSEERAMEVIGAGAQALAAHLLEHGRLVAPQEAWLKRDAWERRS